MGEYEGEGALQKGASGQGLWGEGQSRRRLGRKGTGTVGRGTIETRKDEGRESWEESAQGMGAAEGASSTREWARREARRVRAEERDSPGASWEEARREGGASSGTVVSDIGKA